MRDDQEVWFPAKRYGWGWGLPVKWQGWAALLLYVGIVILASLRFPPHRELPIFLAVVLLATLAFGLLCWWKGERPQWRWGGREE
jgi:hypothetical protein